MKNNEEVIDDLREYFLKQDPKHIAHTLAALMIDFQRLVNFESLEKNEQACLGFRIKRNVEELERFINKGSTEFDTFRYVNVGSEEQE